jgi:hypothetical protein
MGDDERWASFPDPAYAADYQISTLGNTRRATAGPRTARGRLLRPAIGAGGHPVVNLSSGGKTRSFAVAPAVARVFLAPGPPGHLLAHRDEDRGNCAAINLLWVPSDDPRVAGRRRPGARALDPALEAEARSLRGQVTAKAAALRYGVSDFTIRKIWRETE